MREIDEEVRARSAVFSPIDADNADEAGAGESPDRDNPTSAFYIQRPIKTTTKRNEVNPVGRKHKNARPRQHGRRVHLNKYITQRGRTKPSAAVPSAEPTSVVSALPKAKQRTIEQMERQAIGPITPCRSGFQSAATRTDRKHTNLYPRQYEIWFADLGYHYGTSIQGGCRPVLIVSNDTANQHSRTLTVIPLTTKMKKLEMPTHVILTEADCDMLRSEYLLNSLLLAEQVATIDKSMLGNRLCRIKSAEKIAAVKAALKAQLGYTEQPSNAEAQPSDTKAQSGNAASDEQQDNTDDNQNSIETEVNISGS